MSGFYNGAQVRITPSHFMPNILLPRSLATGVWETTAGGQPLVQLSEIDKAVYVKQIGMTTEALISQQQSRKQPSANVFYNEIMTPTYNVSNRSDYDNFAVSEGAHFGINVPEALRLAARQGIGGSLRDMFIVGVRANEGLINSPLALRTTLGNDTSGGTTYPTWAPNQLYQKILNLMGDLATRILALGSPLKYVIVAPQRFIQVLDYSVVPLANFQTQGGGTNTVAGSIQNVMNSLGCDIIFTVDDTLIGKGDGTVSAPTDMVTISVPEISTRDRDYGTVTNEFAKLMPNVTGTIFQLVDSPAPREIPTPVPDGGITTLYQQRATSGWPLRGQAITLLSAKYS